LTDQSDDDLIFRIDEIKVLAREALFVSFQFKMHSRASTIFATGREIESMIQFFQPTWFRTYTAIEF